MKWKEVAMENLLSESLESRICNRSDGVNDMRVVSLDIGLKRIGLAVTYGRGIVFPQEAIIRKGRNQAARDVTERLRELEVDTIVVGIPIGGSSEEEMRRRIEHFISLLDIDENIEVHYQDESGSSMEAKESMRGVIREKRDGRVDSIAAKIILERWLESGCGSNTTIGRLS